MQLGLLDSGNHQLSRADQFPEMTQGRAIFFVEPDGFDLVDAINPHMRDAQGQLHRLDKAKAHQQWSDLVEVYRHLGFAISIFQHRIGCPDMVFCANQSFPFLDQDGKPAAILSNMHNETRHQEVQTIRSELEKKGVIVHSLPPRSAETLFEGMGDALWVPGRRLILGGYGFRTHPQIYQRVHQLTETPIVLFELKQPKFYHLDTCLSILDDRTALACREGFTAEGWEQLERLFSRLIEVPLEEADAPSFACNAHCPDQKHVIMQKGSDRTQAALNEYGFIPVELETGEFIKSGGSVFCMKLQTVWNDWYN